MFSVDNYVTRKGTNKPVGVIEAVNGNLSATVRWGVSDGRVYRDEIPQDQLELFSEKVYSPEEVQLRQAEATGAIYHIEEEKAE